MSGRITRAFEDLKSSGGRGLIPFVTAGDPDLDTTLELILCLASSGATVIELGVPFTDPMADGPVIQRSSQRALERGGVDVGSILSVVQKARECTEVPIILFGYLNPFLSYGLDRLSNDAVQAGVDGLLVTDVIDREFHDLAGKLSDNGLDLITLVAPTTTDERLREISQSARGFIYAVSRTGVTGEGAEMRSSAESLVERVRKATDLPVAVGFGVSTREHVDAVLKFADAAVVGSAIVKVIEGSSGTERTLEAVKDFVTGLLID